MSSEGLRGADIRNIALVVNLKGLKKDIISGEIKNWSRFIIAS
jgi:hypothetical protein